MLTRCKQQNNADVLSNPLHSGLLVVWYSLDCLHRLRILQFATKSRIFGAAEKPQIVHVRGVGLDQHVILAMCAIRQQ